MGWKYLNTKPKAEKVDKSIRGIIQDMAGGKSAHRVDALKFGLYGALRQRGSAKHPFAQLRCPDKSCAAHHNPVSYLSQGNSVDCTRHKNGFGSSFFGTTSTSKVMECSKCGHPRTDHCTWCKGCRRPF